MSDLFRKTSVVKSNEVQWEYEASAGSAVATAVIAYKDNFVGWNTRCPLFASRHPDLPDFRLTKIKANREEGDLIKVTLTYEASTEGAEYPGRPEGDPQIERYSVQVSGREEHILTNEYAEDIEEDERIMLYQIANGADIPKATVGEGENEIKGTDDVITSDAAKSLLIKIRKGNISYKTGGLIYIARKVVTSLSEIDYSNIGKRDNPPGPAGGSTENWLYIGASAEPSEDGERWTLERQWEFSPDGWDADLY